MEKATGTTFFPVFRDSSCSGCGETKTESVPAMGHDYQNGACANRGDVCPILSASYESAAGSGTLSDPASGSIPMTMPEGNTSNITGQAHTQQMNTFWLAPMTAPIPVPGSPPVC